MAKKLYSEKDILEAKNFFKLPSYATMKDIKDAYTQMAKKYHPDTTGHKKTYAEKRMQKINKAYAILKNYAANYKYSFKEDAIRKYNPAAKSNRGFSNDWNWGKGR